MKQTNCENWKDNPSPPKEFLTALPEGARHQWCRRSRPAIFLAERRKPPGSGAKACGPGAKNVGDKNDGVEASVRHEHRAASRAGRLTPLRSFRSATTISPCVRAIAYGSAVNEDGGKRTRFSDARAGRLTPLR
jgi:hypothetical protein